jgi:DNA-binding NarL/FixJ family response regulator
MAAPFETSVICPVLIGRELQLAALGRLIAQAYRGHGQTALVAGEAGIGKSRLVAEIKRHAVQQGFAVLQGRCFEPDGVLPYAPLLDLLRAFVAVQPPNDVAELLGTTAAELVKLLPELTVALPDLSPGSALEPQQEHRRLRQAIVQFFARLAARKSLLVIIEDLHWCDESSLEALLALARLVPTQPILLALTYRSDEVHSELAAFLAALDREHLATEMLLPRLSAGDIDALIRATFDLPHSVQPEFLEALHAVTEGNPFFVEEVLKSLLAAGEIFYADDAWSRKPLGELRLPRSVQVAVQRRLDQVSQEAREVLTCAAVAGRRFDFALLQALTGRDEPTLLRLIKQLIRAQLVVEESADVFAFRHALTQQAVGADLLARERRALHRAIGEAMERIYPRSIEAHLTDLAHHFFAAEIWDRAMAYARRAGEQAQALYAPRAAVDQFTRAIAAAEQLGQLPPLEVYRARGQAHELLGDFEAALHDYTQALEVARTAHDLQGEWQSLLALGFLWSGRDFTQTGECFRLALELAQRMNDLATVAHSLNRLGNWHMMIEQPIEAQRRHEQALSVFSAHTDRRGLAETLDLLGTTNISAGDTLQGAMYYQQAITLFRGLGDRHGLASSLTMLALCCDHYLANTYMAADTNRLSLSLNHAEEAHTIARESGWRYGEALALIVKGQILGAGGEYGRALETLQDGLAIAVEVEHHQWQVDAHLILGALYLDLLAAPTARQHFQQALILAEAIRSLYWLRTVAGFLASTCIFQGELEQADALLTKVLGPDTPAVTMGQRHAWCARAELALAWNKPTQALEILERMYAAAPNVPPHGEHKIPRLAILRAEALAGLGRAGEAEVVLRAAQTTANERGIQSAQWRILARLASLYYTQGRREEAEAASTEARAIVADLAASLSDAALRETLVRGAAAQMKHIRPLSPRHVAKQTYAGLTAREREVAALIAQGKSNRALADALVVSERTIAKHVENILSKLGFTSRAQIAAWAVEKGLAKGDA